MCDYKTVFKPFLTCFDIDGGNCLQYQLVDVFGFLSKLTLSEDDLYNNDLSLSCDVFQCVLLVIPSSSSHSLPKT